jgi:hypothetical protein
MSINFSELKTTEDVYIEIGRRYVAETRLQEAIAAALNGTYYEFAAAKKKASGKKNCNPAKSHFCQTPNGTGSCVSLGKQCKFKPSGSVKQAAVYTGENASSAIAAPEKPKKSTKKTTKKAEAVPVKEIDTAGIHEDFVPLYKMANGFKPDEIKLTDDQVEAAKGFMEDKYKGTPKQKQIKKEGKTTDEESQALANWLGISYQEMSARIWKATSVEDSDGGILAADILAAKALHKLPSATAEQIAKGAEKKGVYDFDPTKPLKRWMRIKGEGGAEEFIKKYQDNIGKEITEDNFFGTSHLSANQMSAFSTGANVIYQVEAKLDGTGQGKYVDHYKKTMSEGEILFPPYSKFKVVKVVAPKTDPLSKEEHTSIAIHDAVEEAKFMSSLIGTSMKGQYKYLTGKTLPKDWKDQVELAKKAKEKLKNFDSQDGHLDAYTIHLQEI